MKRRSKIHIHCPNARDETGKVHQDTRKSHTVIRRGSFTRGCDQRVVQRYFCKECALNFSAQTLSESYRQRKTWINAPLERLITSGVSKRRSAEILGVCRDTIDRKVALLAKFARQWQQLFLERREKFDDLQFDDLETFEHTRLKPLSVPLVISACHRFIIAIGVAQMPAKGSLAAKSVQKYGRRRDKRPASWNRVLGRAAQFSSADARILSDENPHYPRFIKAHFHEVVHRTTPGGRGSVAGYGELKKKGFDPMFSLNHTCAMLRDNIGCLKRRTWNTTKRPDRLQDLLDIYTKNHNIRILRKQDLLH